MDADDHLRYEVSLGLGGLENVRDETHVSATDTSSNIANGSESVIIVINILL